MKCILYEYVSPVNRFVNFFIDSFVLIFCMMNFPPPLRIGLAGFTMLERALLQQWLAADRPDACWVHPISLSALPPLDALVLDGPGSLRWCELTAAGMATPLPALQIGAWPSGSALPEQAPGLVVAQATDADAVRHLLRRWLAPQQPPGSTPAAPAPQRLRARMAFSPREHEVLALLSRGHSNEEIAGLLAIRVPTVKTYLRRVFERTGALNRAHAVALYMGYKALPPAG